MKFLYYDGTGGIKEGVENRREQAEIPPYSALTAKSTAVPTRTGIAAVTHPDCAVGGRPCLAHNYPLNIEGKFAQDFRGLHFFMQPLFKIFFSSGTTFYLLVEYQNTV